MPLTKRQVILIVAAAASVFHMYAAGVAPFTALVQRPVHLALMAALGFLGVGVRAKRSAVSAEDGSRWPGYLSATLGVLLVVSCIYLVTQHRARGLARSSSSWSSLAASPGGASSPFAFWR